MKKGVFFFGIISVLVFCSSWLTGRFDNGRGNLVNVDGQDSIIKLYRKPIAEWPRPDIDSGVHWSELGALPKDSAYLEWDRNDTVKLGKLLFFDPRLSRSDQISCSSCHEPDMVWQDGRRVSLGNDHLQGSRNTPSLLNVFIQKALFWDGRSGSLSEQASAPLAQHHEMDMDIAQLADKLSSIQGYKTYFKNAYGDERVTLERITGAIAAFEITLRSRRTKFDYFLQGRYKALNDQEIRGLHLFRTKARCMNCHNGVYLTDLGFHNIGLTYYGRKYEDLGRYDVTKDPEDVGKFKTPSLRDLMRSRPWMHNGIFDNLMGVVNIYNSGMHQLDKKGDRAIDPKYPQTDPLLRPLGLNTAEKEDLVAFLESLTGVEYKMARPELPQ